MVGRGERTKGESTGHCILRGRSQTLRSHPAAAQSPSGLSQLWDCPCSLVPPPPPTRPGSCLRREGHRGAGVKSWMPWEPHSFAPVIVILGKLYSSSSLLSPWRFHGSGFIDPQVATEPSCVPTPCWAWGGRGAGWATQPLPDCS